MLLACTGADDTTPAASQGDSGGADEGSDRTVYTLQQSIAMTMTVTTTAITRFGRLEQNHTCEGENLSLPISWRGAPEGTESLAIVFEDLAGPDGQPWTHWLAYNLPPDTTDLAEGAVNSGTIPPGSLIGRNDSAEVAYSGPCPPPMLLKSTLCSAPTTGSDAKDYDLKVYALDAVLDLDEGAGRNEALRSIEGHVIAGGEVVIEYRTRRRITGTGASTC